MCLCPKAEIRSAYRSDHSPIEITLNISKQPRGKGQWKLNNKLLENQEYLNMDRNEINLAKATYALPIYHPEYVKDNTGTDLEININDALLLDTLLCQIRGETIKFSKKIARENRLYESRLIENIETIEKSIDSIEDQINKELLSDYLDSKKEELEQWRENKLNGAMVRSRATINSQWEKPSSFLLNLEKKNFLNKSIPELLDNEGNAHTDIKEIMEMQHSFYNDLFTAKTITPIPDSKYDYLISNLPKLPDHLKQNMDSEITIEELELVIKRSKLNKAPGPDGFSNEFFKTFSHELTKMDF